MTNSDDPLGPLLALNGVADAVAEARTAVDRLRGHRVMRRSSEKVTAESLRRGAVASAAVETGAALSPLRDQWMLETGGRPDPAPAGADPVDDLTGGDVRVDVAAAVRGAGRAYGELGVLGDTWVRSPLQVLARLHLLCARDIAAAEQLGRPRTGSQRVVPGPYDAVLGPAPGAAVVAERLDGLVRVLAATSAPALVVAAVVHAEVATVRPFGWGNTVVAMAAQRLVLVGRGLDPRAQAVVEVGHLELSDEYGDALLAYLSGTAEGVSAWLRHCGSAVVAGAAEGLAICESLGR